MKVSKPDPARPSLGPGNLSFWQRLACRFGWRPFAPSALAERIAVLLDEPEGWSLNEWGTLCKGYMEADGGEYESIHASFLVRAPGLYRDISGLLTWRERKWLSVRARKLYRELAGGQAPTAVARLEASQRELEGMRPAIEELLGVTTPQGESRGLLTAPPPAPGSTAAGTSSS